MRIIRNRKDIAAFLCVLKERASGTRRNIEERVRAILDDVRMNGDKAVFKYTKAYDYKNVKSLKIVSKEVSSHAAQAEIRVVKALKRSAKRIKAFHKKQKDTSWSFSEKGAQLGQLVRPLDRVGVYIPGGTASYPSTVLMNVIPAQVAGVKEIALCVPAPKGQINPYVMAAIKLLGVKEVYRIGGAQAIGALAYGTESIKKVDKIVGPGNIYVTAAKKMVFGDVDIDMVAGPSEILIIADSSANPVFIAADLLSQAEHDEFSSAILMTPSAKLAGDVQQELEQQIRNLKRRNIAKKSLESYGALLVTKTIKEATELSNSIAPEHLEIMTKEPGKVLPMIKNAGAIFLGEWTPEALGDYAAGPNHTLPTAGTARFSSPLGIYDFVKRSSLLKFSREGFSRLSGTVRTIASVEGLGAHENSIIVRERALHDRRRTKRD